MRLHDQAAQSSLERWLNGRSLQTTCHTVVFLGGAQRYPQPTQAIQHCNFHFGQAFLARVCLLLPWSEGMLLPGPTHLHAIPIPGTHHCHFLASATVSIHPMVGCQQVRCCRYQNLFIYSGRLGLCLSRSLSVQIRRHRGLPGKSNFSLQTGVSFAK